MRPRELHIRCGKHGRVLFYSPPTGTTWGGLFGMRLKETRFPNDILLSPRAARRLALELNRRAALLEEAMNQ